MSQSPEFTYLAQSGINHEGMALMSEAEVDAQEAMAMMERGRRTLREARAQQHFVKLSRQYSVNKPRPAPFVKKESSSTASTKCLSCGGAAPKIVQRSQRASRWIRKPIKKPRSSASLTGSLQLTAQRVARFPPRRPWNRGKPSSTGERREQWGQ